MEHIYNLIDSIIDGIGLPQGIKEDARTVAIRMVESRIASRVNPSIVALASVMVACRFNNVGIGFKQLSTALPGKYSSRKVVKKAFELARKYVEVFKPQIGVARYEDYVKIASHFLEVPEDVVEVAEKLVKEFKDRYGRRFKPMAVAGAAIYIAR